MKKKLLSLILVATMSFGITACGNSTDSKRVAELEEQTEELQQQLEEAKQGQTDSSTSTGNFDSETQSLIDSINADTAEYQGVCGADAKWYYKDNVLVIKGTGEITDNPWRNDSYDMLDINWVIIDEGIVSINCRVADEYYSITKVILPSTLNKIGEMAFCGCETLSTIDFPNGLSEIGHNAFKGCTSLTDITIPDSVTEIDAGAFELCENLENVNLSNNLVQIEAYTFDGCTSLTTITIPDGVTTIGDGAFDCCRSLTTITIPDSVTTIGNGAFDCCRSLTTITIPDSVTTIGESAFYGCDSLDTSTSEKINSINSNAFIESEY